ncbi:STAS domain-containing protein [Micromonospora globbae]|jgi:hypothetical protein|uniref:STAS domain-containing protein n=1 Tax=Micromonospora globbae TaxID=1894969 RepID=A0A420F8I5_9ACTN|nr:STAS domain-containing protein [Micromonospora globbae]RKF29234.1 STAS domain-containing protein [Micromonospora globbae]
MSFAVTALPAIAGHRWVCVEGTVDASTAGDVRSVLDGALRPPTRRLTIDLSRARVTDPAGRRCLADMTARAEALGIETSVVDPGRSLPGHAVATPPEPAAASAELALA